MTEVKNLVNFNDEEMKIIKDDVHKIHQKFLNTSFKRFFLVKALKSWPIVS